MRSRSPWRSRAIRSTSSPAWPASRAPSTSRCPIPRGRRCCSPAARLRSCASTPQRPIRSAPSPPSSRDARGGCASALPARRRRGRLPHLRARRSDRAPPRPARREGPARRAPPLRPLPGVGSRARHSGRCSPCVATPAARPGSSAWATPAPSLERAARAGPLAAGLPVDEYRAAVRRILAYLAAGDCYQVNLTQPFSAPLAAPPWAVFASPRAPRIRPRTRPTSTSATRWSVATRPSSSCAGADAASRRGPSRGRARAAATPRATRRWPPSCERDPKERAEHVMIVDLERNDLGRVCVARDVRVDGCSTSSAIRTRASPGVARRRRPCATTSTSRRCSPRSSPADRSPARRSCARWRSSPSWRAARAASTPARSDSSLPRGDLELGLPIRTAVVATGVLAGTPAAASSPTRIPSASWPRRGSRPAAIRLALGERLDQERGVLVWLNGRLSPTRARLASRRSIAACCTATGLYDTWRTYDGEPFAVAAHLRRLAAAARVLEPAAARPGRRRGRGARASSCGATACATPPSGSRSPAAPPATTCVPGPRAHDRPSSSPCAALPADLAEQQARGIAAVLLPFPRDVAPPWGGVQAARPRRAPCSDGMLAGRGAARARASTSPRRGDVTEGTTSNLFLVERGAAGDAAFRVRRPRRRDARPRPARSRAGAGLPVREEPSRSPGCGAADELFVTVVDGRDPAARRGSTADAGRWTPGPGHPRRSSERYRAAVAAAIRRARVAGSRSYLIARPREPWTGWGR